MLNLSLIQQSLKLKKVLDSCRPHAAPGTDGLTVYFYQQFWDLMGDSLTEVICAVLKGATPSPSQRTSLMVFGNKPGKKAKSLFISDRCKLSLINVDFKLMTGIEAARICKIMCRRISHLQLVTGGTNAYHTPWQWPVTLYTPPRSAGTGVEFLTRILLQPSAIWSRPGASRSCPKRDSRPK